MSNLALFFQLLQRLGPRLAEAWPHIQALIQILASQPQVEFATASEPTVENFLDTAKAAGVPEEEASAAASKLQ